MHWQAGCKLIGRLFVKVFVGQLLHENIHR